MAVRRASTSILREVILFPSSPPGLGVLTAFGVFLLPLGLIFYLYARSESQEAPTKC
jgi:uncharacterized membrane protein (DUF373 family)